MAAKPASAEELFRLRQSIVATREELDGLDSSLLPRADALAGLERWITSSAEAFERDLWPRISPLFSADTNEKPSIGRFEVHAFEDLQNVDFSNMLCWLLGNELKTKIAAAVADLPLADGDAIPAEDRQRVRLELERKVRELELREERLIRQAEAQGIILERRGDADPAVVLATQI